MFDFQGFMFDFNDFSLIFNDLCLVLMICVCYKIPNDLAMDFLSLPGRYPFKLTGALFVARHTTAGIICTN